MKQQATIIFFVCLLSAVILAGCGPSEDELNATATQIAADVFTTQTAKAPTPTETPTPNPTLEPLTVITATLESGWILYKAQADGFAIALPPEWISIDLNPETFEDTFAVMGELHPEFGGGLFTSETFRSLMAGGIKFYGLDTSQEAIILGSPATVNIVRIDLGFELPLDTLVALSLEQLESLANPDIPITNQRVTLSDVEAEEFTLVSELPGLGGDPVPVMITQYLLVDGSVQYVVTLGVPIELVDSYSSIFEDIGESFQLID